MRTHLAVAAALVIAVSSPLISVAVSQPKPSRVTFVSSAKQVLDGDSVTLTATVEGVADNVVPGGSVEFFDGATSLGTAQLSPVNGRGEGSLAVTLPVGPHPIMARYAGDATFGMSVSAPEFVIVLAR